MQTGVFGGNHVDPRQTLVLAEGSGLMVSATRLRPALTLMR